MNLTKGTEIEVIIQHLNINGKGIGKFKDRNVAVSRLVPGDKAIVKIRKIKKKYIEADLVEIIEKSDLRIEARSKHAEYSGSPWEILPYEYQLDIKQKEVERILSNINIENKTEPIFGMEDPWFYRNKMQFSFGFDIDMNPVLGFHVAGRKYDIYDLEEDCLCESWVPEFVTYFRDKTLKAEHTPYMFKKGEGELRELTLRVGKRTKEVMVILTVSEQMNEEVASKILEQALINLPYLTSAWLEVVTVKKGRQTDRQLTHIGGTEHIQEELTVDNKPLKFLIGPNTFFQPNTQQAEVIYGQVANLADLDGSQIVYDLFCGTGTIGLSLAHNAKRIYGIDLIKESIDKAHENMSANNIKNATYIVGDIFKTRLDWPIPDVVVFDPPRAGLNLKLIEFVASLKPKQIIYVSCNLKSFAHDLVEFKNLGWDLKSIQPVDQFPHTRHLEVVASLTESQ
jgi:23S rRNA (uracil1939-C5)-methyltransferase